MKLSRKSIALYSFLVGASILTTSALADVFMGSGYYSLKNAAKTTAAKVINEVESFTIGATATVKVDDVTITEQTNYTKYDMINEQSESFSKSYQNGETRESYYFTDREQSISKDMETGSYHVYNNYNRRRSDSEQEWKIIENPFEQEQAEDIEKIIDAFVGSLQDIIQVEDVDNKKMYIGNLSDTQVPPLVNAVSSYFVKYAIFNQYSYERLQLPIPKSNVYVLDVSGRAIENETGILESVIGSMRVSAEDENGTEHIYCVEVSFEIKDINSTIVTMPDLEGKDVSYSRSGFELDEKYIGKYKSDIVKEQSSKFVKIGERYIEITSIDGNSVNGRYYEEYNDGQAPDVVRDFEIYSKKLDRDFFNVAFAYIDEEGNEKTGFIHRQNMGNIYVQFEVEMRENGGYSSEEFKEGFDNNFTRVFE